MKNLLLIFAVCTFAFAQEPAAVQTPGTNVEKETPAPVKKRRSLKNVLTRTYPTAAPKAPKAALTALLPPGSNAQIAGIVVTLQDGTQATVGLGTWLTFQNSQLRVIFPLQYVNQISVLQVNKTWKHPQAGRNVQVWRNGLIQRLGADYTLDQVAGIITPIPITLGDGTVVGWNDTDYVTVAYIY